MTRESETCVESRLRASREPQGVLLGMGQECVGHAGAANQVRPEHVEH